MSNQRVSDLIRPVPIGGSSLTQEYLRESTGVARFFAGSPFRLESFQNKLQETRSRFDRDARQRAADALRPSSDRAADRLSRFVEEGGAMITTGQQAGLLTGPLYTIYKAVSAVVLARHLEKHLDTLILPVFWVASEDHDWEEANHAYLLDPKNRLRRVEAETRDPRPLAMSERRVIGIDSILEEAVQVVGGNKRTAEEVKQIIDLWRAPDATMGSAFAAAIGRILSPFDVCIADAADPALKHASRPVLAEALTGTAEAERALAERSAELDQAGFRTQVSVLEGGTNVFYHGDQGRERLYRRESGYAIRGSKWRRDEGELLQELEEDPSRFSPNVFLRPVVESYVFPTLAYVGGPGEIAYFAQVNALFEVNGIQPPVVVPRFAGLVVEPKMERLLDDLGLGLEDVKLDRPALLERLAQNEVPEDVRASLERLREELVGRFENLMSVSGELGVNLTASLAAARNRAMAETARAERKIIRSIKQGDRIAVDKLDRVLDSLRPHGHPQDRVLNVLPFLARYGDHFLRETERTIQQSWRLPVIGD